MATKKARKSSRRSRPSTRRKPQFYECGICGTYHPRSWNGDCREDAARFFPDDLDAKYGSSGWTEVSMPGARHGDVVHEGAPADDWRSVFGTLAHNREFTVKDLREYTQFSTRLSRLPVTVANLIRRMVRGGLLKQTSRGHYAPTPEGWRWIEGRA